MEGAGPLDRHLIKVNQSQDCGKGKTSCREMSGEGSQKTCNGGTLQREKCGETVKSSKSTFKFDSSFDSDINDDTVLLSLCKSKKSEVASDKKKDENEIKKHEKVKNKKLNFQKLRKNIETKDKFIEKSDKSEILKNKSKVCPSKGTKTVKIQSLSKQMENVLDIPSTEASEASSVESVTAIESSTKSPVKTSSSESANGAKSPKPSPKGSPGSSPVMFDICTAVFPCRETKTKENIKSSTMRKKISNEGVRKSPILTVVKGDSNLNGSSSSSLDTGNLSCSSESSIDQRRQSVSSQNSLKNGCVSKRKTKKKTKNRGSELALELAKLCDDSCGSDNKSLVIASGPSPEKHKGKSKEVSKLKKTKKCYQTLQNYFTATSQRTKKRKSDGYLSSPECKRPTKSRQELREEHLSLVSELVNMNKSGSSDSEVMNTSQKESTAVHDELIKGEESDTTVKDHSESPVFHSQVPRKQFSKDSSGLIDRLMPKKNEQRPVIKAISFSDDSITPPPSPKAISNDKLKHCDNKPKKSKFRGSKQLLLAQMIDSGSDSSDIEGPPKRQRIVTLSHQTTDTKGPVKKRKQRKRAPVNAPALLKPVKQGGKKLKLKKGMLGQKKINNMFLRYCFRK